MKVKYLITALILVSFDCSDQNLFDKEILAFEKNYKPIVNNLIDTLLKIKDLDTSYFMEFSPRYNNTVRFLTIDSLNRRADYIDIDFTLSENQKSFFNETSTDRLTYLKKYNCFLLKPFYFKRGDKTLLIVINKDPNEKMNKYKNVLKKIYQKNNYTYYIAYAWGNG